MSTHALSPDHTAPAAPSPYLERIPALVMDLELAEPLPAVPPVDEHGRRPERVWLLVRLFSEPLGPLVLNLPDDGLTPTDLAEAVRDAYGERIRSRVALAGGWLDGVPVDGIEVPQVPGFLQFRNRVWREAPPITVVVAGPQRPEPLRRCLTSLRELSYPEYRVVVVESTPGDDRVAAVVREFPEVAYRREPRSGVALARNRAAEEYRGQILAFLDGEAVVDPYWLLEVARGLVEHPDADVVCGAVVPAELHTQAQLWCEEFGGPTSQRGYSPTVFSLRDAHVQDPLVPLPAFGSAANMTFRPGVLDRIGGFDPALGVGTPVGAGEETLAFTRVLRTGGTIAYQPSALVRQYHRRDLAGLEKRLYAAGAALTAMLAALVMAEPRILRRLLPLLPGALADLFGRHSPRLAGLGRDFPRELLRANRRGMLRGIFAYLAGRRRIRHSPPAHQKV